MFPTGSVLPEEPCTDPYARYCGQTGAVVAASSDPIREFSNTFMDRDFVDAVVDLILATTHKACPTDRIQQLICSIYLASFGYPWGRFLEDSANYRAEFEGAEDDHYPDKRRFLEALL